MSSSHRSWFEKKEKQHVPSIVVLDEYDGTIRQTQKRDPD